MRPKAAFFERHYPPLSNLKLETWDLKLGGPALIPGFDS
jgi:hypothetical protein